MKGRILTAGAMIAGLEACWLYALLGLLQAKTGITFSEAGILCFYLLSYAYYAWTPWPRSRWLLRELTGGLLWAVIFIGGAWLAEAGGWPNSAITQAIIGSLWPAGLVTTAISATLWVMGHRLGNHEPGFPFCLGKFQFGIVMLMVIYVVDSKLHILLASLLPVTIVFFVFSLSALLLARANEGTHASQEHRRGWRFILLAGSLILILAVAYWIFSVVQVGLLERIFTTMGEMSRFVGRTIARLFAFLTGLFPEPKIYPVDIREPRVFRPRDVPVQVVSPLLPDIVLWVGRIILFMGWLILILLVLWTISADVLNWLRKRLRFSDGAEEETLRGAFREDLLRLFRAIWERIVALIERFRLRRAKTPLAPGIAGVRQAYRRLLAWAAAGGCRRRPALTPHEYLTQLKEWLPEAGGEFTFITGRYVEARYGPGSVGEETLRELAHCLRSVRRLRRRRTMRMPFRVP
jgi:hypothetical protein